MQINWKTIRDLMRADLMTMQGGKGNTKVTAIGAVLFFLAIGFIVSPLGGLYVPFLLGAFFVPTLFHNEMKYHGAKLWSLLPIQRRDLVLSRFLLFFGIYTLFGAAFYLLMLLSMRLELWGILFASPDGALVDIIDMMAEKLGFSKLGFFNLCYSACFTFGMMTTASTLRKYFRDPEKFNFAMSLGAHLKKSGKGEFIAAGIILGILALWILIVTDILPIGKFGVLLIALFQQLASAANGFMLMAVLLTIAVFHSVYQYVSTLIEYEKSDL